MSKRWGNVIDPLDVIAEYGAERFRCYEVSWAARADETWSMRGVEGRVRFSPRSGV